MKITFLGTGSAFSKQNGQTNLLISDVWPSQKDRKMLVDCGNQVHFMLDDVGMSYLDIEAVYISHLHADHIGGLEELALCTFLDPRYTGKPKLFLNKALDLWDSSLKGGLGTIEGKIMQLKDYFDIEYIEPNGSFNWNGVEFQTVQVVHIMDGYAIKPSFGLLFNAPSTTKIVEKGTPVFITTDTQHNPNQIKKFYDMADLIIHDCETAPFKSSVHAHYSELITLDDKTKSKMILSHYQDGDLADAIGDGFIGFANNGNVIDLNGEVNLKTYRTLIRIVEITPDDDIFVVIPAWNYDKPIKISKDLLGEEYGIGSRYFGYVNLGAANETELEITNVEEATTPEGKWEKLLSKYKAID
ncbi:MAG: ribonuclease Z [Candidatus Peribacteraceae bacterium]|nr:ribonuclease Z [Candidatus Peribacteraceae bacterium]